MPGRTTLRISSPATDDPLIAQPDPPPPVRIGPIFVCIGPEPRDDVGMGHYPETPQGRADRRYAAEMRLEIIDALITAVDRKERLLAVVEQSVDADDAVRIVMQEFGFAESQAVAALDLQVRRFTPSERQRIIVERDQLRREVETSRRSDKP